MPAIACHHGALTFSCRGGEEDWGVRDELGRLPGGEWGGCLCDGVGCGFGVCFRLDGATGGCEEDMWRWGRTVEDGWGGGRSSAVGPRRRCCAGCVCRSCRRHPRRGWRGHRRHREAGKQGRKEVVAVGVGRRPVPWLGDELPCARVVVVRSLLEDGDAHACVPL